MFEGKFEEIDKEKFILFLNFVATKAKFNDMTTQEVINYFNLLNYMQRVMIPKIEKNILEVIEVNDPEEDENKEE